MRLFLLCFAEEFDSYIIVSFVNATLVLSIGETVEEVTDSGFLGTTPTLSCSLLGEDALLQVLLIIFLLRRRFPIQGRTKGGGGGGRQGGNCHPPPPRKPEKTIFTIFRMSLLIILWIFSAYRLYSLYCHPLVKKSCVRPCSNIILSQLLLLT